MNGKRQHASLGALALLALVGCESPQETDGARATGKELVSGPDFLVKDLSHPPHVRPDRPFEATVTVCNQGDSPGDLDVRLYLANEEQQTEPEQVSNFWVQELWPGRCTRRTVPVHPLHGGGTWRLSAHLETLWGGPDVDPSNDTHVSAPIGIGYQPDFVVRSVEGPASARPQNEVRAQVTVCNQGTESGSTEVALILSEDEVPRFPSPTGPEEDSVLTITGTPMLEPGQCVPMSLRGPFYPPHSSTPATSGTYFLGAVVNPFAQSTEFDTGNNTSGYWLGWGFGPDFVITSVQGPSSTVMGNPLPTQVTVCNQGTDTGMFQVDLYLTRNPLAPTSPPEGSPEEFPVGSTHYGYNSLAPTQCATVPINGAAYRPDAPPEVRAFWLGARVKSDGSPEIRQDNNTHTGHLLGLGHGPDAVITSVQGPPSVRRDNPFITRVTVCNQGNEPASGDVRVRLGEEDALRVLVPPGAPEEPFIGSAPLPHLYPGQCTTVPVPGHAYSYLAAPGVALYLSAEVRLYPAEVELRRDNNTHPGYRLGVGNGPDFVVTSVTGPTSARPGDPISAQVTVCNQGTESGSTDVALVLSQDDTLRVAQNPTPFDDVVVNMFFTNELPPGQCTTRAMSGPAYLPPPPYPDSTPIYHLGAVANPFRQPFELVLENNTHVGGQVRFGLGPDFVITSVTGPASARPGDPITAQVTVCNQGTAPGDTDVRVYLSTDTQFPSPLPPEYGGGFDSGDHFVGGTWTPLLESGQCVTLPITGPAQPPPGSQYIPGAYYLGAVAHPAGARHNELDLGNNTHAGYRLGMGDAPDFVITSVTGPSSTRPGQSVTARVTVCNQGTRTDSTQVHLVLSEDERIQLPTFPWEPFEDTFVNSEYTHPLAPGQCTTLPITGPIWPSSGNPDTRAYHLGAMVDPDRSSGELFEDNNTHSGYLLGVGDSPDFVITSMTNPGFVRAGQPLTTQVRVCNQGTQSGDTQLLVLLSSDEHIQAPSSGPGGPSGDYVVAQAHTGMLPPGACTTLPLSVPSVWPPPSSNPEDPQGLYHLGAVVNPERVPELIETNNTRLAGRLYILP
ncbi:CARDB domain-containing protein [Melittangium boletus]|uniref:CARDB domain-containing protein n=1 Tax=Melittangium boletus DSM 14713 TaxID=1294270 RepID=A0A250I9R3_9BACT|nr:CARDB domain-containing protein [Melittangium boletus]ATB27911.1 hypothetical protein MEBOL_001356 [Melittangium boletus DSM 14713]